MAFTTSTALREARCNLEDIFATDPRPTLIIDVLHETTRGVHLDFANEAFRQQYGVLLRFITSGSLLEPDFVEWLRSPGPSEAEFLLGDLSWTFFTIERRWKVVIVSASGHNGHSVERGSGLIQSEHSEIYQRGIETKLPSSVVSSDADISEKTGSALKVALPSGLVSLGRTPTALEDLHRSVDMLDVGFFEYDLDGTLIYANKSWYTMSGHSYDPEAHTQRRFLDLCHPDDMTIVTDAWTQLLEGKPITFEMRWENMNSSTSKALGAQWVQTACLPLFDEKGELRSVSGCTTDINNQKLGEKIAHSRAEALERARTFEERFVRFAFVAPIVIFNFDASKSMTYCNDRWFEVTTTTKKAFENVVIGEGFYDEDITKLFKLVDEAIRNREVNTIELRLNKPWHASDGRRAQAWMLASIFAEFADDGTFQGCTGTLTEISEFKYAETLQRIRLEDAIEARRQQEHFIDLTSHEMRNPLSAMVQCADSALAGVKEVRSLLGLDSAAGASEKARDQKSRIGEEIELALEGLQTIISCCAHQKCIIDDVLTLSKLDSNLLSITPVRVEPSRVMQEVVKMFEMEALKADVEVTTEVEQSFAELKIQGLMFDPSRVKQILINLVSNAIKFTRNEVTRKVVLRMSASLQAPEASHLEYVPASRSVSDGFLIDKEWGTGEIVYLHFCVEDTGRGLSQKEREKLFKRFSQANPKAHVEYGGSGLGLFITRQLTELQGGEVGLVSEERKGSTFSFYIQTRKSAAPDPGQRRLAPSEASDSGHDSPLTRPSSAAASATSVQDQGKKGAQNVEKLGLHQKIHSQRPLPPSVKETWFPNVLLVEDNIVNQKVLSTQLKRIGCEVTVANHGVEALEFLKATDLWHSGSVASATDPIAAWLLMPSESQEKSRGTVHVILMDIEMPIMDGLTCTRAIRDLERQGVIRRPKKDEHHHKHHQLPIISISANARVEQSMEQREAGVDDIIAKPFRIPALMDKIWRLVGRTSTPP